MTAVEHDIEYRATQAGAPAQRFDLLLPERPVSNAVLIYLHGGA